MIRKKLVRDDSGRWAVMLVQMHDEGGHRWGTIKVRVFPTFWRAVKYRIKQGR